MGCLHCIHPLHPKIISSDLDAGDWAVLNDLVAEEGQQSHSRVTMAVGQPGSLDSHPPNLGKVNQTSIWHLSQQQLLVLLVITHLPEPQAEMAALCSCICGGCLL